MTSRTYRSSLLLATSLLSALAACGDDDDATVAPRRDSGRDEDSGRNGGGGRDGSVSMPERDAGPPTGVKPPELKNEACAADTNKLYELVTSDEPPRPTQLAVDLVGSRFAFAYVGDSDQCINAVYLTQLAGPSGVGEPETMLVSDECTTVEHVAVTHNGSNWLLAIADTRMGALDLWLQSFGGDGDPPEPVRLTETAGEESEAALATVLCDAELFDCTSYVERVVIAWVERDSAGMSRLMVRPLGLDGAPSGDAVMLDESAEWHYTGLSLQQIGENFVGLGYRRFGPATGKSEIVLDVLQTASGERVRDSWVLSAMAGAAGSVDLGTDGRGGAVLYSLGQAQSQQLWFQQLDRTGQAAPVMTGDQIGGPSDPVRIVGPPTIANDASLTKLVNGFAVAYRVLPGGMVPQARIRAHFLDRFGRDIAKSDIALAGELGARTAIDSAYDGRMTVGWSDTSEEGESTLTAVKLPCVGGL
jgi:hypothetical protein